MRVTYDVEGSGHINEPESLRAALGLIGFEVSGAIELPSRAIDVPGGAVDVPGGAIDVPGGAIDVPSGAVDVPGGAIYLLSGGLKRVNSGRHPVGHELALLVLVGMRGPARDHACRLAVADGAL